MVVVPIKEEERLVRLRVLLAVITTGWLLIGDQLRGAGAGQSHEWRRTGRGDTVVMGAYTGCGGDALYQDHIMDVLGEQPELSGCCKWLGTGFVLVCAGSCSSLQEEEKLCMGHGSSSWNYFMLVDVGNGLIVAAFCSSTLSKVCVWTNSWTFRYKLTLPKLLEWFALQRQMTRCLIKFGRLSYLPCGVDDNFSTLNLFALMIC